jgi:hypothetical protein
LYSPDWDGNSYRLKIDSADSIEQLPSNGAASASLLGPAGAAAYAANLELGKKVSYAPIGTVPSGTRWKFIEGLPEPASDSIEKPMPPAIVGEGDAVLPFELEIPRDGTYALVLSNPLLSSGQLVGPVSIRRSGI